MERPKILIIKLIRTNLIELAQNTLDSARVPLVIVEKGVLSENKWQCNDTT